MRQNLIDHFLNGKRPACWRCRSVRRRILSFSLRFDCVTFQDDHDHGDSKATPRKCSNATAKGRAGYPAKAAGPAHAVHSAGISPQGAAPRDCGAPSAIATSSSRQAGKVPSRKWQSANEEKRPVARLSARYSRWLPGSSRSAELEARPAAPGLPSSATRLPGKESKAAACANTLARFKSWKLTNQQRHFAQGRESKAAPAGKPENGK